MQKIDIVCCEWRLGRDINRSIRTISGASTRPRWPASLIGGSAEWKGYQNNLQLWGQCLIKRDISTRSSVQRSIIDVMPAARSPWLNFYWRERIWRLAASINISLYTFFGPAENKNRDISRAPIKIPARRMARRLVSSSFLKAEPARISQYKQCLMTPE